MMPLSQIAGLGRTLDGQRRSPVADAVAACWGYPAGVARHRRPSACHVVAAPGGYLRSSQTGTAAGTGRRGAVARDRAAYGVVCGDFELDNLHWVGTEATAYDVDDAARSWYAADVARSSSTDRTDSVSRRRTQPVAAYRVAGERPRRVLGALRRAAHG